MEFDELFVPPDVGNDYAAGALTRLFGGIITRLHGGGDSDIVTTNWLESVFTVFNTFCLLAMLVVLSYTIYTMIFDTAADGKTFGNASDTKYTILRTVGGIIGFVPVAGGYSAAQVAFFWVLLQGSAFADVMWRHEAENMLDGTPMVASSVTKATPNAIARVKDFGVVFDTLVTGHICGLNGNLINAMLSGDTDVSDSEMSTIGGSGPIQQTKTGLDVESTSNLWDSIQGQSVVEMSQMITFEDGAGAYSGRNNYCGAVRFMDSYSASEDSGGDLAPGLLAARAQQQFQHLAEEVFPDLSEAALDVAKQIVDGERNSDTLLEDSRDAVYAAVATYMGGPSITTTIDSDIIEDAHEGLMAMVSEQGWMMAPVWQRGVASTVSAIEMPGDTLRIEPVRENRLTDFLSGKGYRVNRMDGAVSDLLAQADSDQDAWDQLASSIRNLPPPDSTTPTYGRIGDPTGGGVDSALMNMLYGKIFEVFSPVATNTESGNYGFVDPMIQVQRQGEILSGAGALTLGGGLLTGMAEDSVIGLAVGKLTGAGSVAETLSGALVSLGTTLLIVGMIMIIVIPLVPTIFFYVGTLTWLWQSLDTLFAIPLTFLRLFAPSRDSAMIGDMSQVLLAVFGVFLRPVFMVIGLILSMMVIGIGLSYLHEIFGRLMFFGVATGGEDSVLDSLPGIGMAQSLLDGGWGLIKMIFLMAVYVLAAFLTVLYGSQMITEFGEFALNLMGAAVSRYTSQGAIADKTVLSSGMGYAGAARAAQLPGSVKSGALRDMNQAKRIGNGGGADRPGVPS